MSVFLSLHACVCVYACLFCDCACNMCVCLEGLGVGLLCPGKREGSVCYVLGGLVCPSEIWYDCMTKGAEDVKVFIHFCV